MPTEDPAYAAFLAEGGIATPMADEAALTRYLLAVCPEWSRVPEVVSDRQFAQRLATIGAISQADAIAWAARGYIPAPLAAAVDAIADAQARFAKMLLARQRATSGTTRSPRRSA